MEFKPPIKSIMNWKKTSKFSRLALYTEEDKAKNSEKVKNKNPIKWSDVIFENWVKELEENKVLLSLDSRFAEIRDGPPICNWEEFY